MRKLIFTYAILLGIVSNSFAQYQGKIEVYKYDNVTLHSYTSYEEMGDVTFIIEGANELVVFEAPSFYNSIKEFKSYCESLRKPIVKVAISYHSAGVVQWDPSLVVMIEGMPEFDKGDMVKNMMAGFAERFKGKMDTRPHSNTNVVPADSKQTWAGVSFQFIPAPPTSAFPAADVIIADKVYYMHSAPSISHIRGIRNKESLDQQLTFFKGVKNSGCELFVGSHGVAARMDVIDFQINYLERMKQILGTSTNKDAFISKMKESFYGLAAENNLTATAESLYK